MTKNQTWLHVFSVSALISMLYTANAFAALTGTCSMLATGPVPYGAVTSTDEITLTAGIQSPTLIDRNGVLVPGFATARPTSDGNSYGHVTRKEIPGTGIGGSFVSDYNMLAVVNFDTNTISVNIAFVRYGFKSPTVWGQATYTNVPFTLSAGPIAGSQTMTGTLPTTSVNGIPFPSQLLAAIAIPVNGGKSLLVQGTGTPFSGVCQF